LLKGVKLNENWWKVRSIKSNSFKAWKR
jgi:hypothetical protein